MEQIGKYQLVRKIAVGGMAEVCLAKLAGPHGFEKTLVVKRILPHLAEDPNCVKMFMDEARFAAQLNHPNVVQVFDFGEVDGCYFIAMEYIDGPNLRSIIKHSNKMASPLPLALCARIVAAACEGLAYVHDFVNPETGQPLGLLHRDLSPENIIVSKTGTTKVVDFGIVKSSTDQMHLTATGMLRGKISYMPAEQIQGLTLDRRADIFTLGVVLYEIATGSRPIDATTDLAIMQAIIAQKLIPANKKRADIPSSFQRILNVALAGNRERRYASCRDFQIDLEAFIASSGEAAGTAELAQLASQVLGSSRSLSLTPRTPDRNAPSPIRPSPVLSPDLTQRVPSSVPGTIAEGTVVDHMDSGAAAPRGTPPYRPGVVAGDGASQTGSEELAQPKPASAVAAPKPSNPSGFGAMFAAAGVAVVVLAGTAYYVSSSSASVREYDRLDPTPGAAKPGVPTLANILIESAPEAQIRIGGRVIGDTPIMLRDLTPGTQQLEAFNSTLGFAKQIELTLYPGDNETFRVTVGMGQLEFRIPAKTTVIMDGKVLGQAPLGPMQVYEGKHIAELVNKEFNKEVTIPFEVNPGAPNVLVYELTE